MKTEIETTGAESLDARLERALMRRRTLTFNLWQPLLGLLLAIAAVILFAAAAVKGAEKNANPLERAAFAAADAPRIAHRTAVDILNNYNPRLTRGQRFKGKSGWEIAPDAPVAGMAVLLSRYDGDEKRGLVELVDLAGGGVIGSWRPDVAAINALSALPENEFHLERDFGPRRYMEHHPFALDDGSLIFHGMDSPLVRIDACARVMWTIDGDFHHSIERDADGDFWTVETIHPPSIPYVDRNFDDDAVVKFSPDGRILFRKSAAKMLIDAEFDHIIYSHDQYEEDPIHLNDAQPATFDGPYWKKGDVFLSFRNPSMIALYRPSTDEIVWSKQGPWLMQHDIDIVSDRRIAVFNNNTVAAPYGGKTIGSNDVVLYDFATDETSEPFAEAFRANGVHTETNGLFRFIGDDALMVEEHDYGRLLAFDRAGRVRWSFINRAKKDGRVYDLGWSRLIEGARAEKLKTALAEAKCENGADG